MIRPSLLVLATASSAAFLPAMASAASIAGKVDVYLAGNPARCNGLRLLPRTAQSERQMQIFFGSLGPAKRTVDDESALRDTVGLLAQPPVRDAYCRGWTAGYVFNQVPPGDYFLIALVSVANDGSANSAAGDQTGYRPGGFLYLMQPVRVDAPGQKVGINFVSR